MSDTVKPISPEEALHTFPVKQFIPNEMIQVLNDLIAHKYQGSQFDITVEEIDEAWKHYEGFPKIKSEWLNFEPLYIKRGWDVKWIKDSNYAESGYDRWTFKPK